MQTTIDLLDAALSETDMSARALSLKLGHSPWTLSRSRERGSLSPTLAGQLAELLSLNVERWVAIAALETEPQTRVTTRLRNAIDDSDIIKLTHEPIEWRESSDQRKTPRFRPGAIHTPGRRPLQAPNVRQGRHMH